MFRANWNRVKSRMLIYANLESLRVSDIQLFHSVYGYQDTD